MQNTFPEKWTGKLLGDMHVNRVTNRDLANELGVSEQYVSMLLNSKRTTKGAKERLQTAYHSILEKRATSDSQNTTN